MILLCLFSFWLTFK